nr:MAG TPA: hypothetical protein [Caudoviricetes sp.]
MACPARCRAQRADFRNFSTLHKIFTKKPQFFYT